MKTHYHYFATALLLCLLLATGCRQVFEEHTTQSGNDQLVELSVALASNTKAPVEGTEFVDGTYLFGLVVTKEDKLTLYEAGSSNIQANAVFNAGTPTWTYKWGSKPEKEVLPLLYIGDPMVVVGYYPHNARATAMAEGTDGPLLVPFDLSTSDQQANQTDVLYSEPVSMVYVAGASPKANLLFKHLYALLDFQIRLKDGTKPSKIYQVDVYNEFGKDYLASIGAFAPLTGKIYNPVSGTVTVTGSYTLNKTDYVSIKVMVPQAGGADYKDGNISVQLYDENSGFTTPLEFPIKKEYMTNNALESGGRYTFKLLYDNTAKGTLTLEDWTSEAPPEDSVGSGAKKLWVKRGNLNWAVGNLVADGSDGCKIGTKDDGGLYFQFGSLIGYKGGKTGTGVDSVSWVNEGGAWGGKDFPFSFDNDAEVYPKGWMVGNPKTIWPKATSGNAHRWHFSSLDIVTGEVTTNDVRNGVGDPCNYYLGEPWRLPTTAEWDDLLGVGGVNTDYGVPLKIKETPLEFIASGFREESTGNFLMTATQGHYWSSSVTTSVIYTPDPDDPGAVIEESRARGFDIYFTKGDAVVTESNRRKGSSVRCVFPEPVIPPVTP